MVSSQDITYNLHKTVFLLDKLTDTVLQEELAITFSQFKIIMAIDHSTVSQREIASYWDMTEAAVSRQVDLLVQKKLATRKENPENRREHVLELTKEGKKLYEKGLDVIRKNHNEIFAVLDEREKKVLSEGLHKLLKAMCDGKKDGGCIKCP